jgi:hypothetical protein
MIEKGTGGSNTQTGLHFEKEVALLDLLREIGGYTIKKAALNKSGHEIYFKDTLVARSFKKHDFYQFLHEYHVDEAGILSKKLLPDDALLVPARNTLFIIEVKYQQVAGSVDEKLQTCDFKRKQYLKLVAGLNLNVEYIYVLNDWFKKPEYKDVLDYIQQMHCHYTFNELPLTWLGLPS